MNEREKKKLLKENILVNERITYRQFHQHLFARFFRTNIFWQLF